MKKIRFVLFFTVVICQAYSQNTNDNLPPEFKDVAVQAFAKLTPATKQWFINTANQHPAGSFDTAWTKKKLRERFGAGDADQSIELFTVMMAYQKMANKEAREDKKIQNENKQIGLVAKENKLKVDNAKIDQQKKEADEKAENAMNAANTEMWIGIVSSTAAVVGSGMQQSNQTRSNVRLSPTATQKTDATNPVVKNADLLQKQTNKQQQEKSTSKDDEAKKASDDQRKAMKDAVKKLLDQMEQMKSNLNP